MAFGQSSGPPASSKQIAYLASLLEEAGYGTFREARYQLGFTQRQAGGKFTKSEASELIDRLLEGSDGGGDEGDERRAAAAERANRAHEESQARLVAGLPAELMVGELERRGWTCSPPPER